MVFTKNSNKCHHQIFIKMFLSLKIHVEAYHAAELSQI